MPRPRTVAAAALLLVPIVAGGFFLQGPTGRANYTLFQQVQTLVSRAYVDSMSDSQIFQKSAAGLVRELNDPYSELLPPKASEDFNRTTNGRYGGTGMLIGQQSDAPGAPSYVVVEQVFPNTPAEQGGVVEGDRVIQVDSTPTAGQSLDKVSEMLRGAVGTNVNVTYARPGVPEPIKLHFTRKEVHIPAVQIDTTFTGNVGYIDLQTFNENAASEVFAAVSKLRAEGAKGLVLDMRGNGGGIVDQALAVTSLFLRDGQPIVSVRGRDDAETSTARGTHLTTDMPMVVLVDSNSASATEIVAGALQDHDRALVVGTTTFGKGLVQSLYRLDGGYNLKLTTGKWFTPSGRSIHRERKLLPDGRFVEVHPDSVEPSSIGAYRSDAGRPLTGGGGIHPDLVVAQDTLTTVQRDFFRSIAPSGVKIFQVTQEYAIELKKGVTKDFQEQPAWTAELMQRFAKAGVKIDPKFREVADAELGRNLERTLARMAFGDAAAKVRALPDDRQLEKAIDLLQHSTSQTQLFAAAKQ